MLGPGKPVASGESMASECCGEQRFDGASRSYRVALVAVIAINLSMFVVEALSGFLAGSQALKADALDFAGDTATYATSLAVIGMSVRVRATAALVKGWSLALMAAFVLGSTAIGAFNPDTPEAPIISSIGALALTANVISVLILLRWRDGDANVRSVWLCSRNDAIGNVAVIGAGATVWITQSAWPDLIVAAALAGLFLRSAWSIVGQARLEMAESAASRRSSESAPIHE